MFENILQVLERSTAKLQNALHMAYMTAVKRRVAAFMQKFDPITSAFPQKLLTQWTRLSEAIQQEDDYYLLATKSEYTARITEKDTARDELYGKIEKTVLLYANVDLDAEKHEAALKMLPLMERYAIDVKASYELETNAITQWLQEQTGSAKLTKAAQTLGLKEAVEQLQALNTEFRDLISLRMTEQGLTPMEALKKARAVTDTEYKNFILGLNAYAVVDDDPERFLPLIQALNDEIAYSDQQYKPLKKKNAETLAAQIEANEAKRAEKEAKDGSAEDGEK